MSNFFKQNNLVEIHGDRFIVDIIYAKPENITMHPVYEEVGFGAKAYIHADVAKCLKAVEKKLKDLKLKMRITDAYRPPVAHRRILELLPLEDLFASKPENSLHCYGTAIDCCLTDEKGKNLKFPTEIDAYDKKYAWQIAFGQTDDFYKCFAKARSDFYDEHYSREIYNRELLKSIMLNSGFECIGREWWHFQLPYVKERYPFIEWVEPKSKKTKKGA